jgi:hypothetical protein
VAIVGRVRITAACETKAFGRYPGEGRSIAGRHGLEELDSTIASVKGKGVNQEVVLAALNLFKNVYAKLPRHQRRELIGLVLPKAVGAQWELRGAVARRDQSHALGFFLNPGP